MSSEQTRSAERAKAAPAVALGVAPRPARAGLLHVRIPGRLDALEVRDKYGDPVAQLLFAERLGDVSGGSPTFSRQRSRDSLGFDLSITDVDRALPLLRAKLRELGAPPRAVIEELRDDDQPPIVHSIW